jgi:signal transduction histidine kinase
MSQTFSEPPVVLNVDDTEPLRYAKTRTLERAGYDVIEAGTGADALRLVAERHPAVVLLDIKLPDINGIEICKRIKREHPRVLVLQVSASLVASADRAKGLDSGADAYMTQPAEPEELVAAVGALFRIRNAETALLRLNDTLERRVEERTRELAAANARLQAEIAERAKAEAALVQAQKMEAIGQLTGGIAHDFNNLLAAVVGGLHLIQRRSTEPRVGEIARHALQAAERGVKLIAQLLAFSRTQELEARPVDVNQLIDGMQSLLRQSIGPMVEIRTELDPAAGLVLADANQLELALVNLAINARDAMTGGGRIVLATSRTIGAEDGAAQAWINISVKDNGPGMPPHVKERAFDPFFTTKPAGQGTGLGLSQVYGVARQLGGHASIETEAGEGTTVSIVLPAAEAAAIEDAVPPESEPQPGKQETVLLIEDDADVRSVMSASLLELGYQVVTAVDGDEALRLARVVPVDIAVLDYVMPGLTGAETANRLKEFLPDLPIVFASGHADTRALAGVPGAHHLLRKPFALHELASRLRDELSRTA